MLLGEKAVLTVIHCSRQFRPYTPYNFMFPTFFLDAALHFLTVNADYIFQKEWMHVEMNLIDIDNDKNVFWKLLVLVTISLGNNLY